MGCRVYVCSMSAHVLMCCNKISVLTLNMQLFVEFHVNHAIVWFRFPSSICISCIRNRIRIRIRILALSFHAQWQFMRASHFRIDNMTWNGISKLVNNTNWNKTIHENMKKKIHLNCVQREKKWVKCRKKWSRLQRFPWKCNLAFETYITICNLFSLLLSHPLSLHFLLSVCQS